MFFVGLTGLAAGLILLVYGFNFDSDNMEEMRSLTSHEQVRSLMGREVTVQVGENEPWTGVVTRSSSMNGVSYLGFDETFYNYEVKDVIHVKADSGLFRLAVIIAAISLLVLYSSWRIVEHAIFRNTTGVDAMSIARAGPDSSTFDQFVDELSRRIRQAKNEEDGVVS